MLISIGILAHNEERDIGTLISDLAKQNLLANNALSIEIHVVANGCTDNTVGVSKAALAAQPFHRENIATFVHDLSRPGKSNAWNEFVHRLASPNTDYVFCLDADIRIPEATTLQLVFDKLVSSKTACVAVDESVKDLSEKAQKTITERIILAASGTGYNTRSAIAGALYCVRFDVLKNIWMPIGLPGEDGFLRAMILTSNFTKEENLDRLVFVEGARHIFRVGTHDRRRLPSQRPSRNWHGDQRIALQSHSRNLRKHSQKCGGIHPTQKRGRSRLGERTHQSRDPPRQVYSS